MKSLLSETFLALATTYTTDTHLTETLWQELETAYSGKNRHYHNLHHLEKLLLELTAVKDRIQDWDTMLFALFYHDLVYKAISGDNEEKSAEIAEKRLRSLSFPPERTARCVAHILATKAHAYNEDPDTNLFTDADLSILGQAEETYRMYCNQVRKEYAVYPDLLYKPGRKKVVQHFLNMERIFKTPHFSDLYERQARINLQGELDN